MSSQKRYVLRFPLCALWLAIFLNKRDCTSVRQFNRFGDKASRKATERRQITFVAAMNSAEFCRLSVSELSATRRQCPSPYSTDCRPDEK